MSNNRTRDTEQQRQERISRDQFREFIHNHGWLAEDIQQDMGEDIIVQIWENKQWTGITFLVQLKSTQDIDHHIIKGDSLSYPLEVKDLEHWQDAATPVYVVLWDVCRRTGYWISVDAAIKELNARRPNWRNQKTARIRIPLENKLDAGGLHRIRMALADHYLPAVAQNREWEAKVRLKFPPTEKGREKFAALEGHIKTGQPVQIDGEHIAAIEFPEWWNRLVGRIDISDGFIQLGPAYSDRVVPISLHVISDDGKEISLPYIELREIQQGTEETTLSNEGQSIPLQCTVVAHHATRAINIRFKLEKPGDDIQRTYQIVEFIDALVKGKRLRMILLQNQAHIDLDAPSDITPLNPTFVEVIRKLSVISEKTGTQLVLDDDWRIDEEDFSILHNVFRVLINGRVTYEGARLDLLLDNPDKELLATICDSTEPQTVRVAEETSSVELLGTTISLGPRTLEITGLIECVPLHPDEEKDRQGGMQLQIRDAQVIVEYANWLKPDGAPSE